MIKDMINEIVELEQGLDFNDFNEDTRRDVIERLEELYQIMSKVQLKEKIMKLDI